GIGMTMQNLVLAVQNTVAASDLGAASSAVAFFRSLGGTIGVSVLGAVLSTHVGDLIVKGLAAIPGASAAAAASASGSVGLADFTDAPPVIRNLIRVSYGDATGRIFLISAIVAAIAVVAILFIREIALRTHSGSERLQAESVTAG
ncbi:MAG: drug resistance transporter, EmrB/QacA subfamily, partial [Blastococcus sp.]|nr:drug resistance transporter, EmrB/QacA subfamily [Blastococcus sp.]